MGMNAQHLPRFGLPLGCSKQYTGYICGSLIVLASALKYGVDFIKSYLMRFAQY